MATVYKIEVEVTSPWVAYTPEQMNEIIKNILENNNVVKLENVETK